MHLIADTNMVLPDPTVITVPFGEKRKRICKVISLTDGGFAMTPPAHEAKSGVLFKAPHISEVGNVIVSVEDTVHYQASDRVKLSYHANGFVQFSRAGSTPVRSGLDENGVARGVGIFSEPITSPISSGPCVGISAWGLESFIDWKPKRREYVIEFEEVDFHADQFDTGKKDGWIEGVYVSFLMMRTAYVERYLGCSRTGDRFILSPRPGQIAPARRLPARAIRVSNEISLAALITRTWFGFPSSSGYHLGGPSDLRQSIQAVYPSLLIEGPSIDHVLRTQD